MGKNKREDLPLTTLNLFDLPTELVEKIILFLDRPSLIIMCKILYDSDRSDYFLENLTKVLLKLYKKDFFLLAIEIFNSKPLLAKCLQVFLAQKEKTTRTNLYPICDLIKQYCSQLTDLDELITRTKPVYAAMPYNEFSNFIQEIKFFIPELLMQLLKQDEKFLSLNQELCVTIEALLYSMSYQDYSYPSLHWLLPRENNFQGILWLKILISLKNITSYTTVLQLIIDHLLIMITEESYIPEIYLIAIFCLFPKISNEQISADCTQVLNWLGKICHHLEENVHNIHPHLQVLYFFLRDFLPANCIYNPYNQLCGETIFNNTIEMSAKRLSKLSNEKSSTEISNLLTKFSNIFANTTTTTFREVPEPIYLERIKFNYT